MILFWEDIEKRYKNYSNIKTKVGREVKKGSLILLKKGLYTDDRNAHGFVFANAIYSPSYVSFVTALKIHGLTEVDQTVFQSATRNKNRHKNYVNELGEFSYRDVPSKIFHQANVYLNFGSYTILVASREKAICDTLYSLETLTSAKALKTYLFDELKISEEEFWKMNLELILSLCPLYKSRTLNVLERIIEKRLGIVHVKKNNKKASSKNKAKDAWDALAAFRNKYVDN